MCRSVPKRLYTLEELRWNKIDSTQLLSPKDTTLDAVSTQLQVILIIGIIAAGVASGDVATSGTLALLSVFLGGVDVILNGGGGRALLVDTLGRKLKPTYACATAFMATAIPRSAVVWVLMVVRHCYAAFSMRVQPRP